MSDIDSDSERMVIRVEQGKGRKDRYAMLSQPLLDLLRAWWLAARPLGVMLPGGWLFPGQNPVNPLTTRQLRRAFDGAKAAAGIDKPGAEGRHPRDPGPARAQEARHDRAL
jgi:integrase